MLLSFVKYRRHDRLDLCRLLRAFLVTGLLFSLQDWFVKVLIIMAKFRMFSSSLWVLEQLVLLWRFLHDRISRLLIVLIGIVEVLGFRAMLTDLLEGLISFGGCLVSLSLLLLAVVVHSARMNRSIDDGVIVLESHQFFVEIAVVSGS